MNLLSETKAILILNNKTLLDIDWIGIDGECIGMGSMEDVSNTLDVDYDNGYGLEEIDLDLIIVGEDWWLERWEYEGSEGWSFKVMPKYGMPAEKPLKVKMR